MVEKLNAKAFGFSFAVLGGLCMLLFGILGNLGLHLGGVELMQQMHVFFSLSLGGIIAGIVEGSVFGFVMGWLIASLYNRFA